MLILLERIVSDRRLLHLHDHLHLSGERTCWEQYYCEVVKNQCGRWVSAGIIVS